MSHLLRTNRNRKCPVCSHDSWCLLTPDGALVLCMREPSSREKRLKTGDLGWWHRLDGKELQPRQREYAPESKLRTHLDCDAIMWRYASDTIPGDVDRLAWHLHVDGGALRRLGAAWSERHRAWAFPMRDSSGEICGIRLRAMDGAKWAVRGSRQGLFIPSDLSGNGPLLMPEGPTDTAALLSLGFDVVGRPSCSGGVAELIGYLRAYPRRDVVIVADIDNHNAGQHGAEAAATAVHQAHVARSIKVIRPIGAKDAREWVHAGATANMLRAVIGNARPWRGWPAPAKPAMQASYNWTDAARIE